MIRSLFVSLFFFFGPALLLFMLRNITLLLLLRAKNKQQAQEPEVIDVTPVKKERAPNWFYALVIAVSLACAVTVFINLQHGDTEVHNYVPAHVDESGKIVPSDWNGKK